MDRLEDALKAVSLDPGKWPEALRALEIYMGCSDLHLVSINPKTQSILQNYPLNAVEAVEEFAELIDVCEPVNFAARNPGWSVIKDQDFISEGEMRRSEFYAWVTGFDARYRLGLRLLRQADADAHVWILKAESQGPVTIDDVRRLERVAPQLRLAAQVSNAISDLPLVHEHVVEAFEQTQRAALILDGRGSLVVANATARTILATQDGISAGRSGLSFASRATQDRFHVLLRAATGADRGTALACGGRMLADRPSGLPSYVLLVSELPRQHWFSLSPVQAKVLVLIADPAKTGCTLTDALAAAYGLTRREAKIAVQFAQGADLKSIARAHDVSLITVRNQFKSLMAKTATRRQADLMRLLMLFHRG